MITVKTYQEGPLDANNYLVFDEESKDAVLIDCSSSNPELIQSVKDCGVNLKQILLTHGHFDHVLGVKGFEDEFGVKTFINKDDLSQIKMVPDMLRMFLGMSNVESPVIENFLKDGDVIALGNSEIKVISTPGHTKGGLCYLIEDKLFSGDTLFQGSCGRCDLPEGDFNQIVKSIKEKLFVLPDNTEVLSGHGAKSTIAYEKKYNEILNI